MAKDFFDTHIEIMGSDKELTKKIKKKLKKMLPEKVGTMSDECERCRKSFVTTEMEYHSPFYYCKQCVKKIKSNKKERKEYWGY
jgi:late competence protein required for DNA uptake (superfamily II DNA/RNA helicase)